MEIMYEISYIENTKDNSLRIEITQIKVIRRGIVPGCSKETITAIDLKGEKFWGDPNNYFVSEKEALNYALKEAKESIKDLKDQRKNLDKEIIKIKNSLKNLKLITKENKNGKRCL